MAVDRKAPYTFMGTIRFALQKKGLKDSATLIFLINFSQQFQDI